MSLKQTHSPFPDLALAPRLLGHSKYQALAKEALHSPRDLALALKNFSLDHPLLQYLLDFDLKISLSAQEQSVELCLNVEQLLKDLWERPKDIFFEMAPSLQMIKTLEDIPTLWQELAFSLDAKKKFTEINKTWGQQKKEDLTETYFLINTIMGQSEVHQISQYFYHCLQFLKDDSSSLEALIFEFFNSNDDGPALEKLVGQLISLGTISNYKLIPPH